MTKFLYIVFPIIVALSTASAVQARSPVKVDGATTVDLATAKDLLERGVPFVDVRRAQSYWDGHIPRAVNLHCRTLFRIRVMERKVKR